MVGQERLAGDRVGPVDAGGFQGVGRQADEFLTREGVVLHVQVEGGEAQPVEVAAVAYEPAQQQPLRLRSVSVADTPPNHQANLGSHANETYASAAVVPERATYAWPARGVLERRMEEFDDPVGNCRRGAGVKRA